MRNVSACALARVQSRLNAAAAAAEFLSSVLREVGIVFSRTVVSGWLFLPFGQVSWRIRRKVNTRALSSWRLVGLLNLSREGADVRRGNVPYPLLHVPPQADPHPLMLGRHRALAGTSSRI